MSSSDIKSLGSFVWSIAELLRGDFKQSEYGKVVLPFVVNLVSPEHQSSRHPTDDRSSWAVPKG